MSKGLNKRATLRYVMLNGDMFNGDGSADCASVSDVWSKFREMSGFPQKFSSRKENKSHFYNLHAMYCAL